MESIVLVGTPPHVSGSTAIRAGSAFSHVAPGGTLRDFDDGGDLGVVDLDELSDLDDD